jgi:hypothetical protein
VEHCSQTGHIIDFEEATILVRSMGYMDRLVKEAIEMRLHPNNFNRDSGLMLNHAWGPLIHLLHKVKKVKQHSDGTELERTKARLSYTETG